MNKTIRRGVFETNSSSSHSISISDSDINDFLDTIPLTEDGYLVLTGGQFGWEWEKYNDALTKANYCAIYAINTYGVDSDKYEMLEDVLKTQTGANGVILDMSVDYGDDNYSYIDHNSSDAVLSAFDSKESLRQFIFNKNSMLFLGNDNEYAPDMFYFTPDTVYKYRITIPILRDHDWASHSIHLENLPTSKELINNIVHLLSNLVVLCKGDENIVIHADLLDKPMFMLSSEGYKTYNLLRYYGLTNFNDSSKLINTESKTIRLVNDPLTTIKLNEIDVNDYYEITYEFSKIL